MTGRRRAANRWTGVGRELHCSSVNLLQLSKADKTATCRPMAGISICSNGRGSVSDCSAFVGKGKVRPLKLMQRSTKHIQTFKQLGV